jgi:hypothetical protein
MNIILSRQVNCPNVIGKIRLKTNGTLEIGVVPEFDFVTTAIPKAIISSPMSKII